MNKVIYRFLCALFLLVTLYSIFSSWSYREIIDVKLLLFFVLSLAILIYVSYERKEHYDMVEKQKKELQLYYLYSRPLEELVKEIRTKQHEFDNHVNAILNMHVMIDNYDELVAEQSKYIKEIYDDRNRQFIQLLKISDKVLAGFLYSKIVSATEFVQFDVHVEGKMIFSQAPEHDMIEVIGTLIDNAMEACTEDYNQIKIVIGGREDKMIFEIWNMYSKITLGEIEKFFQKGYTTKDGGERRGFGLYNAKGITERYHGELTVSREKINERDFLCFRLEM